MNAHLTPRTRKAYASAVDKFWDYSEQIGTMGRDGAPQFTAVNLLGYAAYLAHPEGENLVTGTVYSRLSALKNFCEDEGRAWPLGDPRAARRLAQITKGALALKPVEVKVGRGKKLPIYPALLFELLSEHSDCIPDGESLVLPAVAMTAITTLARVGNLLPPSRSALAVPHVKTDKVVYERNSHFNLGLERTKTLPQGHILTAVKTDCPMGAYQTLLTYHRWRNQSGVSSQSYFVKMNGQAYTTAEMRKTLQRLLSAAGETAACYGVHGLRHGGAQGYISAGVSEADVVQLGTWKGRGAHILYLGQPSLAHLREMQSALYGTQGARGAGARGAGARQTAPRR